MNSFNISIFQNLKNEEKSGVGAVLAGDGNGGCSKPYELWYLCCVLNSEHVR